MLRGKLLGNSCKIPSSSFLAVFARQASLLFFSLNVLCLLLMAKALPVKRWGAMGGTMNDIGRWSLKAFASKICRRSLLDKVSVVSNRKPCGLLRVQSLHQVRWLPALLVVFLVRGGMASSAEVCIHEVEPVWPVHRIKIWVNEKDDLQKSWTLNREVLPTSWYFQGCFYGLASLSPTISLFERVALEIWDWPTAANFNLGSALYHKV